MLNKLLAILPFNPSLIDQVSFYGARLKAESSIRRIGFIFISLAFVVQIFAFVSPPQPTLARSNNDLINGGIGSKQDAVAACQNNTEDFGTILSYYGISCGNVNNSSTVNLRSTDYDKQLFSMGRLPYGKAGETPVNVNQKTYYWRYLWAWDSYAFSTYQALKLVSDSGKTFFILYDCGNLVSIGLTSPPALQISKTTLTGYPVSGATVRPGDELGYRVYFNNSGGAAQEVIVSDILPQHTSFVWQGSSDATMGRGQWRWSNMPAGAQNWYVDLKVKVDSTTPNGTQICNAANIRAIGTKELASNQICNAVQAAAVKPTVTPVTPVRTAPVCPYDSSLTADSPQCKSCTDSQSEDDKLACLSFHKTASNITQNVSNANGTTAQPGDVITYTVSITNNGKADVTKYVIQDNISDILDYANAQDLQSGALSTSTGILSWPAQTIPKGQTVKKQFTVTVKNPLPTTPTSASDPGHFDYVMTNVYGDTVNIKLPAPVVQAAAQVTQTLPKTGPGTSLLIGTLVTGTAGYFFARSRLLAKEVAITRANFTGEGIR